MLVLVLANNLLLTFVGWEGVGVCSYWLVSFYFERDVGGLGRQEGLHLQPRRRRRPAARDVPASSAASASLTYLTIFAHTERVLLDRGAPLVVLALLLAATGKRAQIPLFNWLPDAMEGPTPVSALIHAATMVTAGVYLLVPDEPRCSALSPDARLVDRRHRRRHRLRGGDHRHLAEGHQEGPRLLDGLADRLHGPRRGRRRLHRGDLPDDLPRLLQGAALPRFRLGHPRLNGEQDIRRMGGAAQAHALDLRRPSSSAGCRSRRPAVQRASGPRATSSTASTRATRRCGCSGSLTALLTAYYMSRLFVLTFTGDERFSEPVRTASRRTTRTSRPGSMRLPLVVLAVLLDPRSASSTCPGCTATRSDASSTRSSPTRLRPGPRRRGAPVGPRRWWTPSPRVIGIAVGLVLWRGSSESARARAGVPRARLVLGRLLRRDHRSARHAPGRRSRRRRHRPEGHRRRRQRHRWRWPCARPGRCARSRPASVRQYALVLAGRRRRHRSSTSLLRAF